MYRYNIKWDSVVLLIQMQICHRTTCCRTTCRGNSGAARFVACLDVCSHLAQYWRNFCCNTTVWLASVWSVESSNVNLFLFFPFLLLQELTCFKFAQFEKRWIVGAVRWSCCRSSARWTDLESISFSPPSSLSPYSLCVLSLVCSLGRLCTHFRSRPHIPVTTPMHNVLTGEGAQVTN